MSRCLRLSLACILVRTRSGILSAIVLVGAVLLMASASLDPSSIATAVGQSRTLMPDGTWLLIGGRIGSEPIASAAILNPETNQITSLGGGLIQSRAWHSAVLLPDGTVL